MQPRTRVVITFTFIILLVSGLYIFTDWFSKFTGYFLGEGTVEKLARCLHDKKTEFYGTEYCSECEKQREIFGQSFRMITQIECGKNKEFCPNVRSLPAWFINKEIHYGFKTIEELQSISGCAGE